LKRLCHFLGVDAEGSYVHDCCAIVFPSARRTRRRVEWSREERDAVTQIIAHHDSLRDYGWDT
jgi:hypothetical protein